MTWSEGHGSGDATCTYVRQPGLKQALEFQQVFGAQAEGHLPAAATDITVDCQDGTEEGQRKRDGPGFVRGKVGEPAPGEIQLVGKLFLDGPVQGQLEGLIRQRLRVQRVQCEVMVLPIRASELYLQVVEADVLDVEQRKGPVRAHRRLACGIRCLRRSGYGTMESPVVAAVRPDLQLGAHVAARKLVDVHLPLEQQRPEIHRQARFAEARQIALAESGCVGDMQPADAQLRSGRNFHLHRSFEAHLAADVVAEGLRDGCAKKRRIDGDADEGDVQETQYDDQDQRRESPRSPAQEPPQRAGEGVRQHERIIHQLRSGSAGTGRRLQAIGPLIGPGSSGHRCWPPTLSAGFLP